MPRKRETDDLIRVHVMMAREDWNLLNALFADSMGPSRAIRLIIRDYLKRVERKMEETQAEEALERRRSLHLVPPSQPPAAH